MGVEPTRDATRLTPVLKTEEPTGTLPLPRVGSRVEGRGSRGTVGLIALLLLDSGFDWISEFFFARVGIGRVLFGGDPAGRRNSLIEFVEG